MRFSVCVTLSCTHFLFIGGKNTKKSEEILDTWALIFGNKEVRELGKEKSIWFSKIYDALKNDEDGFLEFILSAELRYGNMVAKEDLIPTTSLLLIKWQKKIKEKRKSAVIEMMNQPCFDDYCKEVFFIIKESAKNGDN